MKYMLDTNIFNEILDNDKINLNDFKNEKTFYVTHIQYDEINKTKCEERRNALNEIFSLVEAENLPTENFVLDISRYDLARYGDNLNEEINNYMDTLNKKKAKKNKKDALIAETALKNKLILVTNDPELYDTMIKFGGQAEKFKGFL